MSNYSITTDRQHQMDGLTRIWDEQANMYVEDAGRVVTFATAYDAEQWLERRWLAGVGIAS